MRKPTRRTKVRRRGKRITRRTRRSNFRNKSTIVNSRFGTGFPDAFNIKLKYTDGLSLQSTALDEITAFYRGNVPWDPDTKLGGVSALEYERFQAIYRYCRCYGSKIKIKSVTFNNNTTMLAVAPVSSTQQVEWDLLIADKRAKLSQFMTPAGMTRSILTNYCTTKAVFGLKNRLDDNDHSYDFNNATLNIPQYNWFWYIICTTPEGLSGPINCALEIEITYYCRFFEKIQPQLTVPDDSGTNIDWSINADPRVHIFGPEPGP